MEIRTIKAQKTTVTVKRADGSVETLDIAAKIGSCSKVGFENIILPKIVAANKAAGTIVTAWTHEDAQTVIIWSDAEIKAAKEEKEYLASRAKVLNALNS